MTKIKINWETDEITFYKFICKDATILYTYAGHTTSFRHRKTNHKKSCNNPTDKNYNMPLYQFIRSNGGWSNWEMRPIKTQLCKDKMEARQIETELIDEQAFKLNARRAYTSEEERKAYHTTHYQEHKEEYKIQTAKYYQEHKEERKSYHTTYQQEHKEEIKEYHTTYRQEHKEELNAQNTKYYQEHKEELKAQTAKYYQENREVINAKKREKYAQQKALKQAQEQAVKNAGVEPQITET